MSSDVLVVGSANADLFVSVDRRPGSGETVLGGDTEVLPGGKGANTAVAAGRLGAEVALVGAVGDDSYGRLLLDSLRDADVDTELLRISERPTGIAYITVTPDGENSIIVSPGANASLEPADVDNVFAGAKVVVASLEVPLPTVEHAVAKAAAEGVLVVLNLSPPAKLSPETLAAVDVLIVNEHEAAWLTDEDADPRRLLDLGPRAAILTLGAAGAAVARRGTDSVAVVPSPKVEVVDTTGAGDAFAGALAASLADGADLVTAAERAVKVAAFSVTRRGAQPSYPTKAELGE